MKMEKSERVLICSANYKWTNSWVSGAERVGGPGSNGPTALSWVVLVLTVLHLATPFPLIPICPSNVQPASGFLYQ